MPVKREPVFLLPQKKALVTLIGQAAKCYCSFMEFGAFDSGSMGGMFYRLGH